MHGARRGEAVRTSRPRGVRPGGRGDVRSAGGLRDGPHHPSRGRRRAWWRTAAHRATCVASPKRGITFHRFADPRLARRIGLRHHRQVRTENDPARPACPNSSPQSSGRREPPHDCCLLRSASLIVARRPRPATLRVRPIATCSARISGTGGVSGPTKIQSWLSRTGRLVVTSGSATRRVRCRTVQYRDP
jgi:hypothetical protein